MEIKAKNTRKECRPMWRKKYVRKLSEDGDLFITEKREMNYKIKALSHTKTTKSRPHNKPKLNKI